MQFEKEVMSVSELAATGIANKEMIRQWCHIPGNRFAYRNPGGKKLRIKTREFQKWLESKQEMVGGRGRA